MEKYVNGEKIKTLFENEEVRVETIESFGNASPEGFWYEQKEDEMVVLKEGTATLRLGDEVVNLAAGDNLYIPAGLKHRVEQVSSDARWLCLFIK